MGLNNKKLQKRHVYRVILQNKLRTELCNVFAFIMSTYKDYKEILNSDLCTERVFAASITEIVLFFLFRIE